MHKCSLCNQEIKTILHKCGIKDHLGGLVLGGSTSWGNPHLPGKAGNYD